MSGSNGKSKENGLDPTESRLIDLSVTQTPMVNIPALSEAYRKAAREGKDHFVFEGRKFHTRATRFLIERMTGRRIEPGG